MKGLDCLFNDAPQLVRGRNRQGGTKVRSKQITKVVQKMNNEGANSINLTQRNWSGTTAPFSILN